MPTAYNHLGPRAEGGCGGQLSHSPHCLQLVTAPEIWPFSPKIGNLTFPAPLPSQILLKVNVHNIPETHREWSKNSGQIILTTEAYFLPGILLMKMSISFGVSDHPKVSSVLIREVE